MTHIIPSVAPVTGYTKHHISSLHSHVQLTVGSPFLPTDKNGKFLWFVIIIIMFKKIFLLLALLP